MVLIEDALERALEIPETPLRIVSLVPSLTELVCDVGAGDRLVGVTPFCTEPAEVVAKLPKVGGPKNPDIAAIAALQPDLVLAVMEENRRRDVEALDARGLPTYVADVRTVDQAINLIGEIGALVDGDDATAVALASAARLAVEGAQKAAPREPVPVFCPVWRDPWITLSVDTYMSDLLRICGAVPVPPGRYDRRYPKVTLDEVRAAAPSVILLPDEPYEFTEADAAELADIAPAHFIDGKLLGWYGRRTAGIQSIVTLLTD